MSKATGPDSLHRLTVIRQRLQEPLRLAVAGKVKAGKSTLLNALLGEELAPTDAGECTQIVTWYQHADRPEVFLHPRAAPPRSTHFARTGGALDIDLQGLTPDEVDHLEVRWPTRWLRDLTLVDTPGIASISANLSARTQRVLAPEDDRPPIVDAVLYLLRHTHASDVRFLESFHDDELVHGTPMNAVGVLSRADEIGSCRLDALDVAERVADRYQHEPRLRRLCPVVVPVAGLLGHAGGTLREAEFRALARLAAVGAADRTELMLTADRFADPGSTVDVTEVERRHLLARLGLFGVRLSVELIRTRSATTATELSRELTRRSGLGRLRTVLLRQFTERSRILQARSALTALNAVLAAGGCSDVDGLRFDVEQITSSAHAFQEVRLLDRLRTDGLDLPSDQAAELDRLLGGAGHAPARRLGLADDKNPAEIKEAALDALTRWRSIGEHPLSTRPVQLAASAASRTMEGILAQLADPPVLR